MYGHIVHVHVYIDHNIPCTCALVWCVRWREEAEMESIRYQERLQQLEKEKTDVVLTLKKKIDTLEVSKTNEIGRLQDIH